MAKSSASNSISKQDKKQLVDQSHEEYQHALEYRAKREDTWRDIDDLYFGKKRKSLVTRANIHIPKLQGTIETFLSKVDEAPFIEYEEATLQDKPQAKMMNGLIRRQRNIDDWDLVDTLGKKEAALYGRTIYKKFAYTSDSAFVDAFSIVDVLDFLIDPLAGGLKPFQNCNYCGQDNIIKSIHDLENDDKYDQEAVKKMAKELTSDSEADNKYNSKAARRRSLGLSQAVLVKNKSIRLVEWYTRYKGEWYYVLFSPEHKKAVRCDTLEGAIGFDELPFASWAPFPRSIEFWTMGLGDLLAEPNRVQNILMSQILDNNAYRNYGMKAYDATKVNNPEMLTPRPMGKIPVNGNPNDIVKDITFPEINNAISAFNLMEQVFARETGVPGQAKGMPNSKRMSATEFSGLLDQVADRFFTANKIYTHALRRIAYLYHLGVMAHMRQPQKIKILGAKDGHKETDVRGSDVKTQARLDALINTGAQKEANKNMMRDRFIEFVNSASELGIPNTKFLTEKFAQVMGLNQAEIDRLMSENPDTDWEILAAAEQENEELLRKDVEPNKSATAQHIERHLDFIRGSNDLDADVKERVLRHVRDEVEFVKKNEQLRVNKIIQEETRKGARDGIRQAAQNPNQPPPTQQQAPQPQAPQPQAPQDLQAPAPQMPPATTTQEAVRFDAIRNAPPNQ